jgi:nickel-dependent lactate racemase
MGMRNDGSGCEKKKLCRESSGRKLPYGIIERLLRLVKMLHPLETIAQRISFDDERRVPLARRRDGRRALRPIDAASAAVAALRAPVEYPPLDQSIVPGDSVAIAVDASVPSVVELIRGSIRAFTHAGVEAESISIVAATLELADTCRANLNRNGESDVRVVLHDPEDENNLCLVGTTARREPLLVNRTIYDADVVLPIGTACLTGDSYAGLFPQFSTQAAIDRFRTPASVESAAAQAAQRREVQEAGWLIGVPMLMQAVPGAGDGLADVVAGEPQAVGARARSRYRQLWSRRSPRRASLVIATVTGGPLSQTWWNVGRALSAAEQLADDDGAVALCTNLDRPLGESLNRLLGNSDSEAAARSVFHDHAEDSWAAWQLARAVERGPVYLLSQLEDETIEDLGLAPVADIDEIIRLAGRHESCIVLEDAQHTVVHVQNE